MTSDQERKVKDLLVTALRCEANSREQFVREHSEGDETVAQEVLTLLQATVTSAAPTTAPMNLPAPGTLLGNRYRITEELSRGGFGVVYLAQDQNLLGKAVVVKLQLDSMPDDSWFERKFSDEIRALSMLDHPGIVHALDSGKTSDGKPYLVMQYVQGRPLRAVMSADGMPLDRVAEIVRQIGQALAAAHDKKIWHRDLKPENIMLQAVTGGDHVQLIDFGIATIADLQASRRMTRVVGSVAYMAPEQIEGQASAASDIWAFGVIAYEMITGRKPFIADHVVQLAQLQQKGVRLKPSDLRPGVPAAAESLILQALSVEPRNRPRDAGEFGSSLADSLLADPAPALAAERPRTAFKSAWAWALGAIVLLAAGAGTWVLEHGAPKSPSLPAAATANLTKSTPAATPPLVPASATPNSDQQFAKGARVTGAALNPAANTDRGIRPEAAAAGTVRTNPVDHQHYVWIGPGQFKMGCSQGDGECMPAERPRHRVALSRGFWLGQTEMTVGAYQRFAAATHRPMPPENRLNPGWATADFPVVEIDWQDASEYCRWAGGRLPTEAEWEYAARAGTEGTLYGTLDNIAWSAYNSGRAPLEVDEDAPGDRAAPERKLLTNGNSMHAVATKQANTWGLYDMLGNASEWVNDWSSGAYYKDSPSENPPGLATGEKKVVRGGNWRQLEKSSRLSARVLLAPTVRGPGIGARCAIDALP